MIRDKAQSRSHVVHIDAIAIQPDKLRMEFTSPVGIYLGTFVLNEKQVSYILADNNRLRTLPANENSMRPLIRTPLDPYLLVDILFDIEPKGSGWLCERDEKSFLKKCNNEDKKISLNWLQRQSRQRALEIETPSARIQLSLQGFRSKVETDENTFKILPK